jgi:hypothetical protein
MHMSKRETLGFAAAVALGVLALSGLSGGSLAQARGRSSEGIYSGSFQPDWRGSRAYRIARDRGYHTGRDRGKDDARDGRQPDPDNSSHYRDADSGYKREYGPIEAYREGYREGFRRGYHEAYRRYSRR